MALVLAVVLEVGGFWLGARVSNGRGPPAIKRILLAVGLVYVCLLVFPWPYYSHVGSAEQFRAAAAVPLWEHWPLLITLVVGGAWMFGVLAATALRLYKMGAVTLSLLLCAPLLLSACSGPDYTPQTTVSMQRQLRDARASAMSERKPAPLRLAVSHDAESIVRSWTAGRESELGLPAPDLLVRDEGQTITALIDGRVDAALLHRMPNAAEERYSRGDGLVARMTLSYESVARCAVVLLVHPENPVKAVSVDKAIQMLSGEVRDWAQVGALEGRVQLYAGERSASSYIATEELLNGATFSARMQTMPSDKGVTGAVASEVNGLGLGSASSVEGVRILGIRGVDGKVRRYLPLDPMEPESILSRQLYLVSRGEPSAEVVKLKEYATSKSGVAIAELNSYVVESASY